MSRARQGKPTSRRRADAADAASGEQSSAPPEKRIICNSTDSRTDRGTILDGYRYVGITLAEALARLLSLPTVISQPPGGEPFIPRVDTLAPPPGLSAAEEIRWRLVQTDSAPTLAILVAPHRQPRRTGWLSEVEAESQLELAIGARADLV
jgi:hypothetical protein